MKHAAVLAGIGTLGKSTLLLNSEYGNMLNIGAVLTNLNLPSDVPADNICIKGCRLCIYKYPVNAIGEQFSRTSHYSNLNFAVFFRLTSNIGISFNHM